ncbi:MAG: glycosyltransferase family 2 protein [Ignavibacteriae bacterium]|nr:glycosyltransferase family 2 protein [Ignavibacteriota bacterium]
MPKITLSMIVKNEDKYLRGCLESVKGIVDEIVIVDTGSTDNTLNIAEEFNAKIFHFEWIKDFSAARNFALSKSTGDWILYLDADERINAKSKNELLNKTKISNKLAINCIINNIDDYKDSSSIMKYVRLFRNNKNLLFTGKAHEQIQPSLTKLNYKLVDSTIEIIHLGYNVSRNVLIQKAERNLELLLAEYKEQPTSYGAYQISNSYSILNNRDTAVEYAKRALEGKDLSKEIRSICYLHITDYELNIGRIEIAKKMIDEALQENNNHPLLNLLSSQIYLKLNENIKALGFCKNSLQQNVKLKKSKKNRSAIDIVVDDKKIIYQGILISLSTDNSEDLKYFLKKLSNVAEKEEILLVNILQNNQTNENDIYLLQEIIKDSSLELILKLLKKNNNVEFKLDFFSSIYDKFNSDIGYLTNFGEFLISINQLEEAELILKTSLEVNGNNIAAIFYLASIYVVSEDFQKLAEIIKIAEAKIAYNSPYFNKLQILKEKIAPLISLPNLSIN